MVSRVCVVTVRNEIGPPSQTALPCARSESAASKCSVSAGLVKFGSSTSSWTLEPSAGPHSSEPNWDSSEPVIPL